MNVSVHRLHVANTKYLDGRIDIYAYLIRSEDNLVLVDTGVGQGNSFIDKTFEPEITSIIDELARLEVDPSDITLLVNSHLHFDHCGNNHLFQNAEIYVQAAELEVARGERYTVKDWFDYEGAQLHPIEGDYDLCPGVKLLSTPGHTPGHQSVVVETEGAPWLVVAQAAYTLDEFARGGDPKEQAHPGLESDYTATIKGLQELGATRLFFSHDDRESMSGPIE